jgi:hypothetical protein
MIFGKDGRAIQRPCMSQICLKPEPNGNPSKDDSPICRGIFYEHIFALSGFVLFISDGGKSNNYQWARFGKARTIGIMYLIIIA